jgi:hypothetical protein
MHMHCVVTHLLCSIPESTALAYLIFASVALTFLRCLARCEAVGGRSYAAISRRFGGMMSEVDGMRGRCCAMEFGNASGGLREMEGLVSNGWK